MNTILLAQMIELAATNQSSNHLTELALQIAVDPNLNDIVTIDSFSNEFYSVRDIKTIKQCMSFWII